ncbi:hypothetical protein J2T38_001986, partial [Neisseria perflava]|uniref:virulence factor TspB C-terminal domain-related protein n=1 Tax=Neisseria perflava TaxID=33053 RepID=UPI00209E6CD7
DNGGCTAYFSGENTISCLKDSSGVGGDSSGEKSEDSESEEEQEQEEDNPVVNMLASLYNMMKEEMTGLKNAITSSSSGGGSAGSENGSKNGSENGSDEGSETGAENATGDSDYGVLDGVSKSEYSRGGVFQESGSCPSPIPLNFSVLGYGVATEFSFEHVCTVVAKLRPLMIMFGYLVGATMITKALRSS